MFDSEACNRYVEDHRSPGLQHVQMLRRMDSCSDCGQPVPNMGLGASEMMFTAVFHRGQRPERTLSRPVQHSLDQMPTDGQQVGDGDWVILLEALIGGLVDVKQQEVVPGECMTQQSFWIKHVRC